MKTNDVFPLVFKELEKAVIENIPMTELEFIKMKYELRMARLKLLVQKRSRCYVHGHRWVGHVDWPGKWVCFRCFLLGDD